MSTFSAEWLALRESADERSRNKDVANALAAWLMQRASVSVVDLGAGTGANLRAVAPLLPDRQSWTLLDNDPALLEAARRQLCAWAERSERRGDDLVLYKGAAEITVHFRAETLSSNLDQILGAKPDLVTASALFDLLPATVIKALARAIAARRAAFYAVLTYNGLQKWTPHRPADNEMAAAFNRHQMTDKGLGPAAGPMAAAILADQLRLEDYSVLEGESPWRLGQSDRTLIEELQRGHALAVLELKAFDPKSADSKTVESWIKVIRSGALIGHTDIFAVPA